MIINNYEFYKEMMAITNSGPQTLRVIQKGLRRDGSIEDTGTSISPMLQSTDPTKLF